MDEKLLAMLAEDDSTLDAFNIDSDDIDFDAIPKKSDLNKKKINRKPIKCVIPSDSESDPFTIEQQPADPPAKQPPKQPATITADSLNEFSTFNDDLLFSDDAKKPAKPDPPKKSNEKQPEVKILDNTPKQTIIEQKEIPKPQPIQNTTPTMNTIDQRPKWQAQPQPKPKPTTPIEAFEYSLISYLEKASQDATHSFLDEFKFQLNQAATYENIVSSFLSDLSSDIKKIVAEESVQLPQQQYTLNEVNSIINDQFTQISKQLPRSEPKKETAESYTMLNTQINSTIEDFTTKCTPLLMDLKKEVLQSTSAYFDGSEPNKEKLAQHKKVISDLETYSYQQDIEQEYLAKRVQRLKQQQVAFHEQTLSIFTKDTDEDEKFINGDLESLVDELQRFNNNDNDVVFDGYNDSIEQKIRELINLNSTLIGATERILHIPPQQAVISMPMQMPVPSQQSSFLQSSSFLSESHLGDRNEIVANVRERLENLRRKAEKSAKTTSFQNPY